MDVNEMFMGEYNMELRQLEYFCTVSRLENFTRTAEALHVSQPSVTKAIKSLEAELKLTLIDRTHKHVMLTPQGKAFLLHAEKILNDVEKTLQDMERFQLEKKDTIHFGIPPMVEAYLFPDFFTEFRLAIPAIKLDVREYSDSTEVRKKVEDGELDFGIVFDEGRDTQPNEMLIMEDNMSLCLTPGHPLCNNNAVSFDELRHEKFIMQQSNTYQYQHVYNRCVMNGYVPDILLCTTQLKTIKQLVANGLGVSILPDFVTHNEKIFVRKPLEPGLNVDIKLIWGLQPDSAAEKTEAGAEELSGIDKSFLEFMKKYISDGNFKKQLT